MTITATDRKLLWARAYNSCAYCKTELTGDAESASLAGIVYGEEAHMIARSVDGPRGRSGDRSAIDAYANFILLCAKDHKRIDDQPDAFTLERVKSMKQDHERWAREKFNGEPAPEPIRVSRGDNESAVPFEAVESGDHLWLLVSQAHVYNLRMPEGIPRELSDAAEEFLAIARDCGDTHEDVEFGGLRAIEDAQDSLDAALWGLWDKGLVAYGRKLARTISGGILPPGRLNFIELAVLTPPELAAMQEGTSALGIAERGSGLFDLQGILAEGRERPST